MSELLKASKPVSISSESLQQSPPDQEIQQPLFTADDPTENFRKLLDTGSQFLTPKNRQFLEELFRSADEVIVDGNRSKYLRTTTEIGRSIAKTDPEQFGWLIDLHLQFFNRFKHPVREQIDKQMYDSAAQLKDKTGYGSVAHYIRWHREIQIINRAGVLRTGEKVNMQTASQEQRYFDHIFPLLPGSELALIGTLLQESIAHTDLRYREVADAYKQETSLSHLEDWQKEQLFFACIKIYDDAKLIHVSKTGAIKRTARSVEHPISLHTLIQIQKAKKRIDAPVSKNGKGNPIPCTSFDDLEGIYEKNDKNRKMKEIFIKVDGDHQRRLYLTGIALGHQDSAIPFIQRLIQEIEYLPPEMKPHVIVLNNLIAGAFENRSKGQKTALVPELATLEEQFKIGKMLVDRLKEFDIPIVLNLGNPDWEISRDIVMRMLTYQLGLVGHIPYYRQDQLQRREEWSRYDKAATSVILPYCYRLGTIPSEEVLLTLFDVYEEIEQAKLDHRKPQFLPEWQDQIDFSLIPTKDDQEVDPLFFITDDARLRVGNKRSFHSAILQNDFNFSLAAQPPLYGDPLKSLHQRVIQELSTGKMEPGELTLSLLNQHQFMSIAVDSNDTWIESMPSARSNNYLETRGSAKRAADAAHREATTRRQMTEPAAIMTETVGGRRLYYPFVEPLIDLSNSADRTSVVIFGDEQIGSVTARLDYYVRGLDILAQQMHANKVVIPELGDHGQGKNYKGKEHQESAVGKQVDVEQQHRLNNLIIKLALGHVSQEDFANVQQVVIIPGNHELNSGFAQLGTTHLLGLEEVWTRILQEKNSPVRPVLAENAITSDGSFFRGWVAKVSIGGMNFAMQHYPLKKGGKGSGSYPIGGTWGLLKAYMSDAADIHAFHFQHYHQSSMHLVGNKIASIGPSRAGQSEFEVYLGHRAVPGMMMIHVGGGLPPVYEFYSTKALQDHKISRDSIFSDESLADMGFFTDRGFKPRVHGFVPTVEPFNSDSLLARIVPTSHPRSALQKYLWHIQDVLPNQAHTVLGK